MVAMTDLAQECRSESFWLTMPELSPRQKEVLNLLVSHPDGLTAWEISQMTGHLVHCIRPRLTEFKKQGIAWAIGKRFFESTGRNEAIWAIAPRQDLFPETEKRCLT